MYAYGDNDPRADTVATMEEILLEFVGDLCRSAKSCAVQAAPTTITASTKSSTDPITPATGLNGPMTGRGGNARDAGETSQPPAAGSRRGAKDNGRTKGGAAAQATSTSGGERLPYHYRRVKVDDFKFALRKDTKKLGRVEELMALQKEITDARKLFDEKQT